MKKAYEVVEFLIGEKKEGDKIIFKSLTDMESAYRDIDNGLDIYVMKDGIVHKVLHQMISSKIYEGSIKIGAKAKKGEMEVE